MEIADTQVRARGTPIRKPAITRTSQPRMPQLLEWDLIAAGDRVTIRNHPDEMAVVVDHRYVTYQGRQMLFNDWGQKVTGWSSLNIYEWAVDAKTRKTLDTLRQEKVAELEEAETSALDESSLTTDQQDGLFTSLQIASMSQ